MRNILILITLLSGLIFTSLIKNKTRLLEKELLYLDNEINSLNNFFTFSDTKARIKIAIENLNAFMSEVFDVFLTWVIMFFFKNIFFPILFLWLVYKMSNNAILASMIRHPGDIVINPKLDLIEEGLHMF